jgi:hypothetical protein
MGLSWCWLARTAAAPTWCLCSAAICIALDALAGAVIRGSAYRIPFVVVALVTREVRLQLRE